jgi:hypothetical protein
MDLAQLKAIQHEIGAHLDGVPGAEFRAGTRHALRLAAATKENAAHQPAEKKAAAE